MSSIIGVYLDDFRETLESARRFSREKKRGSKRADDKHFRVRLATSKLCDTYQVHCTSFQIFMCRMTRSTFEEGWGFCGGYSERH